MKIRRMAELALAGKRVLIREDLNVPVANGVVTSDARIRAALPTLRQALAAGAKVFVMSHLGRPEEGVHDEQYSLAPVAKRLAELLGQPVELRKDWLAGLDCAPGQLVLCENVRFNKGEKKDQEQLARAMAALCDVFVMDAFGTAHRAEASTHGVARFAPVACAGPLLVGELEALEKALQKPARPLVAIVAGSKVSTKLTVLESLLAQSRSADRRRRHRQHLPGGHRRGRGQVAVREGHAGHRAQASGAGPGARRGHCAAHRCGRGDRVRGHRRGAGARRSAEVRPDELILDIGPQTARHLAAQLHRAGTILWNGPVGVFEFDQFGEGTRTLARAIADSKAFSLAGGGDTLAAIEKYDVEQGISYISTGGGAFLEFVEGKTLPAVAILEARS